MQKVFDVTDGGWRGIGSIPLSKYRLRDEFEKHDAHLKHDVKVEHGVDIQHGCRCHLVIIGKIKPTECPLFMKACTPQKPVGVCMVSIEGTCRIWVKTINRVDK
jgi:hydrogenase expression/formation protein HypD